MRHKHELVRHSELGKGVGAGHRGSRILRMLGPEGRPMGEGGTGLLSQAGLGLGTENSTPRGWGMGSEHQQQDGCDIECVTILKSPWASPERSSPPLLGGEEQLHRRCQWEN